MIKKKDHSKLKARKNLLAIQDWHSPPLCPTDNQDTLPLGLEVQNIGLGLRGKSKGFYWDQAQDLNNPILFGVCPPTNMLIFQISC